MFASRAYLRGLFGSVSRRCDGALSDVRGQIGRLGALLGCLGRVSGTLGAPRGSHGRVGVSGFLGSLRGSAQGLVMAQYMFQIWGTLP